MPKPDDFEVAWWTRSLDELDREIMRLAAICEARILDPGVIERVLHNDASVARTSNPKAFEKLRYLLIVHYEERKKAAAALGEVATAAIVHEIVARLKKRVGGSLGEGAA
jgi:hypothetical protein